MNALLRRRAARAEDDGGFALLFVLFVTTMVMIATAAMLTVVSGNVRPARQSQDNYAATAAAQSGVQDYLAQLDAHCRSVSIQACSWLQSNTTYNGTIGDQTYTVSALNAQGYIAANNGVLRVVSTGRSGANNASVKKLTADLSGTPSVLRFTYLSNYETLGTKFLRSYYGPRTITLSNPATASAVGLNPNSVVHWNGTGTAPTNGYTDTVCDSLYYDDPSNPISGQGRSKLSAGRVDLAPGTDFSEGGYTQNALAGVLLTTRVPVSRDAPCEVRFTKGMTFTGPVYSRDALSINNGTVGSSSGPAFNVPTGETLPPASTGWTTASVPAVTDPAVPFRADALLGGTPTTTKSGAQPVSSATYRVSLPGAADPKADCVYTGPTRIVLSGSNATINSPLTPIVSGNPCYASTGGGTGVSTVVPITSTTIKIRNSATSIPGSAPSFSGLALGANGDITSYSTSLGDAYVQGSLDSGKLSLVASNDIVVTGDITRTLPPGTNGTNTAGEPSWASGAAIDLVANGNVRVYHPVKCKSGTATDGYCPNDISGLYSNTESKLVASTDGTLKSTHPSKQYDNLLSDSGRRIDAAVMALGGSLTVDNFNRGNALGSLTVNGGVYMNHRGALGQLWEVPTTAVSGPRPSSGYFLQLSYLDYSKAGLPFVPVLDDGSNAASPWKILNISTGGS